MITNRNEAKAEHISCDWKKWKKKTSHYVCKNYCKCKKDYIWNPSPSICENSKYLKSIADTLWKLERQE